MSLRALAWNDAKHRAIRHDYPTWLVWRGEWRYEL